MTYVFVYGTLKKGLGNHGVLGNAVYIDEAVTNSREFTMFDGGFPFVSDSFFENNGSIVGELYETHNPEILANLDRLEGVPYLYVKKLVDVTTLQGFKYQATMYVASPGSNERLKEKAPMEPLGRSQLLEWR
jgi:gamma-glutamylaminecyclotransferase